MKSFIEELRATTGRRNEVAVGLRDACAALCVGLAVAGWPGPASAQQCTGGQCPGTTVTATYYGGSTGVVWIGRWDTEARNFDWTGYPGEGGGPIGFPPDRADACASLESQWNAVGCSLGSAGVNAGTNGCGPGGIIGWAVPEAPSPGVSFHGACNGHDRCYGTLGSPRASCDGAFAAEMQASCDGARQRFFFEAMEAGRTVAQANDYADEQVYACHGWSNVYVGAVMARGAPIYAQAQVNAAFCTRLYGVLHEIGCYAY
jgi:hypothetical protein